MRLTGRFLQKFVNTGHCSNPNLLAHKRREYVESLDVKLSEGNYHVIDQVLRRVEEYQYRLVLMP
jgi:hypothetical protein